MAVVSLQGHSLSGGGNPVRSSSKRHPEEAIKATMYLRRVSGHWWFMFLYVLTVPQVQQAPRPPVSLHQAQRVCLQGCRSLVAYVHPKATCAEASAVVVGGSRAGTDCGQLLLEKPSSACLTACS